MSNTISTTNGGASTTIIHRATGGIAGLRELTDETNRIHVLAFPFGAIAEVTATKNLAVPGCYILSNGGVVNIGETANLTARLFDHAGDPAKAFATEVFVVSGIDKWFDKAAAVYFQHRLTKNAERAGLVQVKKGVNPHLVDLPGWRIVSLNRAAADAERMLFDAGCRGFHSNEPSRLPEPVTVNAPALAAASPAADGGDDADDTGLMEIGVSTTPPGVEESELNYGGMWARGYAHGDTFVVAAGSEVRTFTNPSVNALICTRRKELEACDALVPIEGVEDRKRLTVAVAFPSPAIAAKVITGAHVDSGKWRPLGHAQPMILAV